ncbi:MAG TPA: hypothetical protein VK427_19095 [Kofleriaceae bacterium]|nr:hypothetical protein [Kofleriaceae bacterium]
MGVDRRARRNTDKKTATVQPHVPAEPALARGTQPLSTTSQPAEPVATAADDERDTAETIPMERISMLDLVNQPAPEPRRARRTKASIRPLSKPR